MKGNSLDTFFVTASSIWILQFYKIYPLALERRATHVQMLFFQNRQTFVAEIKITCAARRLTVRSFVELQLHSARRYIESSISWKYFRIDYE